MQPFHRARKALLSRETNSSFAGNKNTFPSPTFFRYRIRNDGFLKFPFFNSILPSSPHLQTRDKSSPFTCLPPPNRRGIHQRLVRSELEKQQKISSDDPIPKRRRSPRPRAIRRRIVTSHLQHIKRGSSHSYQPRSEMHSFPSSYICDCLWSLIFCTQRK